MRLSHLLALLSALASCGLGSVAVGQTRYDSPEGVFRAAQEAGNESRTLDFLDCLTPD